MTDMMFFVKTFLLTVVLVLAMQLRVGRHTIEHHAMSFVQSSAIVAPLNGVANGAAKMVRDITDHVSNRVKSNTRKSTRSEK